MMEYTEIDGVQIEFIFAHFLIDDEISDEFIANCHKDDIGLAHEIDTFHWGATEEGHDYWEQKQADLYHYRIKFRASDKPYHPPNFVIDEREVL